MKKMMLAALLIFATKHPAYAATAAAHGLAAQAFLRGLVAEQRLGGLAAQELYSRLNLPETELRDEHGGAAYGRAKYGERLGCARFSDGSAECWFL